MKRFITWLRRLFDTTRLPPPVRGLRDGGMTTFRDIMGRS